MDVLQKLNDFLIMLFQKKFREVELKEMCFISK